MAEYSEYKPAAALAPYIECYWYLKGQTPGGALMQECLVPGGRAELIFTGTPLQWYGSNPYAQPSTHTQPFLLGQRTKVTYVAMQGAYAFAGIRFRHGCQSLFSTGPAMRYTNCILPLRELYRQQAPPLLPAAGDTAVFFNHAEKWLEGVFEGATPYWEHLQSCISYITVNTGFGHTDIKQLLEQTGWSYKKAERIFLNYTGYTPRTFIKLMRFKKVMEECPANSRLTQAAYQFGFYDQPHFIREFHYYTGYPPSRFYKAPPMLARQLYKIA